MSSQCAHSQCKTQMTLQNNLSWSGHSGISKRTIAWTNLLCLHVICGLRFNWKNCCNKAHFSGDYCVDDYTQKLPSDLPGFYSALLSTHWLPLTLPSFMPMGLPKRAQLLRLTLFLPLSSFLLFALSSFSSLKWQRQIKYVRDDSK